MPKNSRPDIQVLEDRIVRLKSQLVEYKDLRLYQTTKNRLSVVSDQLEECIVMIHEIVNKDSNNISATSSSAYDQYPGEGPSEFSYDGDLLDTFLFSPDSEETVSKSSKHSPKEIVKTYSKKLQQCADTVGCSSGIIQVNQFCQVLNSWYKTRYTPSNTKRNPNFFFKADRIHEWIDLLMLAAGHALHEGLFPAFIQDMNAWIQDLNTPKDEEWVLPYSVIRMKSLDPSCCTQEAVLLEKTIKGAIYDDTFYPEKRHSIEKIVISKGRFTAEDMDLSKLVRCNSKIVVTSSFDITKFQEG